MERLLECLVKGLVERPEEVQVTCTEGQDGPVYEIRVAQSDLGKVIGRQGRTANAIRQVARAAASNGAGVRRRVQVEIVS